MTHENPSVNLCVRTGVNPGLMVGILWGAGWNPAVVGWNPVKPVRDFPTGGKSVCQTVCHLSVVDNGKKREKESISDFRELKKPCKSLIYKANRCPELDSNQHTLASAAT